MVAIDVRADIDRIAKYMDSLEKKQLPFATSRTLNSLAVMSQKAICDNIQRVFNNNRRWWDKRQRTGIKVEFSTKHKLDAAVYTRAHFAYIQEEGGIKKPNVGNNLAIPTSNVPKHLRSSKALRREQGNKNVFKAGKSIYKRIYGNRLERLYSLTPRAKVRPRFGFRKTAVNVFNRQFDRVFTKEFDYALATAK